MNAQEMKRVYGYIRASTDKQIASPDTQRQIIEDYAKRLSRSVDRYFIDPATAFSFNISIEAALVSIVGGIGTLWGPVIGTVLLETTSTLLQSWLGSSIGGVQLTVYALILMAVILWRPTGIMGFLSELAARRATRSPAQPAKAAP